MSILVEIGFAPEKTIFFKVDKIQVFSTVHYGSFHESVNLWLKTLESSH